MGQILVRNIKDETLQRLKLKAAERGESLESLVRQALDELARPSREEVLAEMDAIRKAIGPVSGDSTDMIREDRDNDEPYR